MAEARDYGPDELLHRRMSHVRYAARSDDFFAWVVSHVPWRGDEVVLDVGCGAGLYFPYLRSARRVVALDPSARMLASARSRTFPGVSLVQARGEALPFPEGTFDVVFANHVLFFLQDVRRGIAEAHRVLRAGGIFVATTYTEGSFQATYSLHRRALHRVGRVAPPPPHASFSLEKGVALVEDFFPHVEVDRYDDAFLFPTVEAGMAHYRSYAFDRVVGPPLTPTEREQVLEAVRRSIARAVQRHGVWRVDKSSGVIVARS